MVFVVLVVINLVWDIKKIRSQHRSLRWMYISIYSVTFILFVCTLLGIKIPMPTSVFINYISPVAHRILQV